MNTFPYTWKYARGRFSKDKRQGMKCRVVRFIGKLKREVEVEFQEWPGVLHRTHVLQLDPFPVESRIAADEEIARMQIELGGESGGA